MYFDFYDDRPDYLALNRDVTRLEDLLHLIVAVSIAFFLDIVALIVLVAIASMPASGGAKKVALAQPDEPTRFVYIAPMIDTLALKAPPNAPSSDRDRAAASREQSPKPTNALPFSRGNTVERVEEPPAPPPSQRAEPQPQPGQDGQDGQSAQQALALRGPALLSDRSGSAGAPGVPGPLSAAAANPFKYAQGGVFDNPGGSGGEPQASIQFDSKGVEFGPWLRRFIAQVKRNWILPMAAMTMKGRVAVTFNVHRDGRITDLQIVEECPVAAFNRAALGALITSNPTHQLPAEYPADRCFFRVTFYYNELPPDR